ncbi:MAG: polyisoprenoid-binding protein [Burkholderiales bacterium]|nr:polyisoprenoid-binding protein [Burkholderiales bacterium]
MASRALAVAVISLGVAGAARAQVDSYTIDVTHTAVYYEYPHLDLSTNRGRFSVKGGTVQFDPAGRSGRVDLTIDTSSVNSGVVLMNRKMQGPDLFDSADFPTGRFLADRFEFDGDKLVAVQGQLTLRGRSNPVTLSARRFNCYFNPLLERRTCGGDFDTTIQRSQWGIDWGLGMGMPDAVHLLIQVEAIQQ